MSSTRSDGARPKDRATTRTPRGARAREAILHAADDLLVENGFDGVTIEGIAAHAGVAKQTIYRWWNSKADVLMDALLEDVEEELTPVDTGVAVEDLHQHLSRLARFLTDAPAGKVLCALIGEAQHDFRVADQLRERYLDPRRDLDLRILQRGIQRGELDSTLDLDAALDALEGPIYYRALVTRTTIDRAFIDTLIDQAISAPPLSQRRRSRKLAVPRRPRNA